MEEEKVQTPESKWKSCESDFPEIVDDWHGGHEGRSRLIWLYQPAHEIPNRDGTKMYMGPHIYLGYCCWPYVFKLQENGTKIWDYGDPFFVGLWTSGRAAVSQWCYLEKPDAPFDPLEYAHRSGTWVFPDVNESQSLPQNTNQMDG